jgi:hypothetical protein
MAITANANGRLVRVIVSILNLVSKLAYLREVGQFINLALVEIGYRGLHQLREFLEENRIFVPLLMETPARMPPARGFFIHGKFRLIPPAPSIVGPSIAIAVIGPIAVAVIVPSIAIAVIRPSIAVVATAIVIDVFNGCVALRKRCQTSNTGRHRRFCLPDE